MIIFLIIYSLIGIVYATHNLIYVVTDYGLTETIRCIIPNHNWLRILNMVFIVLVMLLTYIIVVVAWPICSVASIIITLIDKICKHQ